MSEQHIWCVMDKEGQIARVHLSGQAAHLSMLDLTGLMPEHAPYRVVRARVILGGEDDSPKN